MDKIQARAAEDLLYQLWYGRIISFGDSFEFEAEKEAWNAIVQATAHRYAEQTNLRSLFKWHIAKMGNTSDRFLRAEGDTWEELRKIYGDVIITIKIWFPSIQRPLDVKLDLTPPEWTLSDRVLQATRRIRRVLRKIKKIAERIKGPRGGKFQQSLNFPRGPFSWQTML